MEYLVIFEDSTIKQTNKITEEDMVMVEQGFFDIIRKQKYKDDFERMTENREWIKVEEFAPQGENEQ